MATPALNSFLSFNFSEREKLEAAVLTPLQKMWIQTLRAQAAESLINLEFDTQNPLSRLAQDAELKGQLKILTHIIEMSEASEQELLLLAQESED